MQLVRKGRASMVTGAVVAALFGVYTTLFMSLMAIAAGTSAVWEAYPMLLVMMVGEAGFAGCMAAILLAVIGRRDEQGLPQEEGLRISIAIPLMTLMLIHRILPPGPESSKDYLMIGVTAYVFWVVSGLIARRLRRFLLRGAAP